MTFVIEESRMVDAKHLLPELKVIAPDLPDDMLLHYIRRSAIEFATRSQIVTKEHCIDVQPCVDEYDIHLTDNETFVSFQDNTVNAGCVKTDNCKTTECNGYNISWSAPRQRLMLSPEPCKHERVCMTISVAPSITACEFDSRLVVDNYKGILYGALFELHALPKGKKGDNNRFDPSRIPYYEHKFQREITSAGMDRLLNNKRGLVKMRKPRII